ncbi:MAG TPA: ABC transporter ATP-binding protein [Stellaceae bacterium]|nr:ABC transporter ATP-binding protein [Stellaceae bacterium]
MTVDQIEPLATPASTTRPLLTVDGLSVGLRGDGAVRPILTDISFDLWPREILGVIGGSGAGKTVLSRALVGWLTAPLVVTAGEVRFEGVDLFAIPPGRIRQIRGKKIAYIGANPTSALDPTLPVGRQIVEKLRAVEPGISARAARQRTLDLLAAVRIPSPASRFEEYPAQFSGGMMQRALIVDALVSNPSLIVADNVTQPLDVTVAAQILRLLRQLRDDFGTAIVFVSSSLPMVREIADEVLVMDQGTVVERQTPAGLLAAPRHAYTKALIERIPSIWVGEGPRQREERTPTETPILSVLDVSKTYHVRRPGTLIAKNAVRAVRNITFDVMARENFGIVGESGCGKSTLTRLLTRLEPPDRGRILFDGTDVGAAGSAELRRLRRRLQLVLQDPYNSMPPRMTIGRIIEEGLLIHGMARELGGLSGLRQRVRDTMAEVGLDPTLYGELPVGLSAGQRQRVNVARAMVLEPKLLILDETLSALDQTEQGRLLDLFERLQTQHGFTYVYISHDLAMVRRVCTRVAVMYLGEVVELADNQTLFFDPGHPYSKALLSAVPTVEERRYRTEDCLLEGEPPSPIDIPAGCGFAPRCPHAFARCETERPRLLARTGRNLAACFLAEGEGAR